jgi:hypothetical protein
MTFAHMSLNLYHSNLRVSKGSPGAQKRLGKRGCCYSFILIITRDNISVVYTSKCCVELRFIHISASAPRTMNF